MTWCWLFHQCTVIIKAYKWYLLQEGVCCRSTTDSVSKARNPLRESASLELELALYRQAEKGLGLCPGCKEMQCQSLMAVNSQLELSV